ncbi:MAG: tRNA-dihydrouridine synthase family protein [bacterium]|nr:tRNA-dihydrouridine synthase family protein [bacterium]
MLWTNKKPIIALAPMADMTDMPFCQISRKIAGDNFIIFREMVSAEALDRESEKTLEMCKFLPLERPLITQFFGSTPEVVARVVARIADRFKPDGVDINMGCPVQKIAGKCGAGSALIKNPLVAAKIIESIKNLVGDSVPVSVKTRLGWSDPEDILKFGPLLQSAGADAITVHGRTREQGYSGVADWNMIARLREKISIPLIANGDIRTAEDMKKCLAVTGADGVMMGRAALGDPWIFIGREPTLVELKATVLEHARLHLERYGPTSLTTFRKHLVHYFKKDRIPSRISKPEFRSALVNIKTLQELESVLSVF